MRVLVRIGLVIACLVAGHSAALAQATVAGVVRDASGAVLPGVTVEAASPALIEKVRTAVDATAPAGTASRICAPATTPSRSRWPGSPR